MNDITERIGKLLITRFGVAPDEFSAQTTLSDLDLDSLALVEFGLIAEKEFGVKIGEDEISPDDTVADVADLIVRKAA
ncbi:acyl carrier protein [Micromonospora sp. BQ11]|uniref:acyl carrier protein n=1 Tax=Micromonospora sp. BQ11 TaxID=3452212 RepID=UPI003F8A1CF0